MKTIISMIAPNGTPVTLEIAPDDDQETILAAIQRSQKIGAWLSANGWTAPQAEAAAGPSAAELAQGPTFAGYPCSPTVDEAGRPTWIIVDGKQAHRREKQGDVWYSLKVNDEYLQVLRIPKGERAPAVQGI